VRILLAEDEVTIAVTLGDALGDRGWQPVLAHDTDAALALLESQPFDVVVTDIRMPGAGGMAVLQRSVELDADRPVLLITGYATVDQAVEAMSEGAAWYVQKPFRNDAVVKLIERFAAGRLAAQENRSLRAKLADLGTIVGLVGASPAMAQVFARIRQVAPTDATVVIQGESGTGKERVARALHDASPRRDGPFVAISCAALPESLLEAELFGHEKGAFTDAHREKRGRFELADGGTLFLDDIDDMPRPTQVKLLRVLQERNFERLGGERTRAVDIRVLAATKVSLRAEVKAGRFREDLFYRIHVVPLELPPLRERAGDVLLLARALIERHAMLLGRRPADIALPKTGLSALERYPWPGNVRELENAVQRAIALCGPSGELELEHLVPLDGRWRGATQVHDDVRPLREVLREAESAYIERALELTGGHRSQTAEILGISRKVLWEKIRDFGLRAGSEDEHADEDNRSPDGGADGARRV